MTYMQLQGIFIESKELPAELCIPILLYMEVIHNKPMTGGNENM